MELQLIVLIISLVFQVLMAIAIAAVGFIAKRSLAALDSVQSAVAQLNLTVVGKYYTRAELDAFNTAFEGRLKECREYARDGLHDLRNNGQEHEVWINLLAQKVDFELPPKARR